MNRSLHDAAGPRYGEGEVDTGDYMNCDQGGGDGTLYENVNNNGQPPPKPRVRFEKEPYGDENQNNVEVIGGDAQMYEVPVGEEQQMYEVPVGEQQQQMYEVPVGQQQQQHGGAQMYEVLVDEQQQQQHGGAQMYECPVEQQQDDGGAYEPAIYENFDEGGHGDASANNGGAAVAEDDEIYCDVGLSENAPPPAEDDGEMYTDVDIPKVHDDDDGDGTDYEDEPEEIYVYDDIDSRSLTDQKQATKDQWEQTLSATDARLFPPALPPPRKLSPSLLAPHGDAAAPFVSSVESHSIGDLLSTKQRWEQIASPTGSGTVTSSSSSGGESTIEREIRLAQERDDELRLEQKRRGGVPPSSGGGVGGSGGGMSVHKLKAVTVVHQQDWASEQHDRQRKWEMTEVDRDVASDHEARKKKSSIIEREIEQQQQRERTLKDEGIIRPSSTGQYAKEQEQSAFEHHEKVRETHAGESVIEREIREQQQREAEIRSLRHRLTGGTHDSSSPPPPPVNHQPSPARQQPVNHHQPSPARQQQPVNHHQPSPARQQQPVNHHQPSPARQPTGSTSSTTSSSSSSSKAVRVDAAQPGRPTPTTAAAAMSSSSKVTYEAAISTFAHPGENMIAREMREQREREDELRTHWKELGFDIRSQEPPDTPFNRPDLHPASQHQHQQQQQQQQRGAATTTAPPSRATDATAAYRRDSHSSQGSLDGGGGGVGGVARAKVQPYTDDDDLQDRQLIFQPQNETPVEREIRMACEREEALRRERGLPTESSAVDGKAPGDPQRPRTMASGSGSSSPAAGAAHGGKEDDKHTMKRFASNRLQYEMRKEKQREVDLRNEGKISTTSEDRTEQRPSYRDIMSPDSGPPPTPRTQTTKPPRQSPLTSEVRLPNGTVGNAPGGVVVRSNVPVRYGDGDDDDEEDEEGGGDGVDGIDKKHSVVESLIEQELREQEQREEELKRERKLATGSPVPPKVATTTSSPVPPPHAAATTPTATNGTTDASSSSATGSSPAVAATTTPKSQSMDAIVTLRSKPDSASAASSSASVIKHRRKSALAEQWEKKFNQAS